MPFQLEHITLAERVALGCSCVMLAGEYGLITGLAQEYGTSRQCLYDLRDRARVALEQALGPGRPGRPPVEQRLVVDRQTVERAVLVLHQVVHGSVRGIQECLAEILETDRSVGAMQGILSATAERARALAPVPSQPLVAVADELFAAGQPVLAVVDHASGLVAALEPATGRDETTWGCTSLDLAARGVAIGSLTADGALGLAAGAQAAGLPAVRLDHWHTLRDLGRVAHVLEARAYRLLTAADRSQRAAAAAQYRAEHGRRPRRGRPLQAPTDPASVAAATRAADEAIARADGVAYLVGAVSQGLRPVEVTTERGRHPTGGAHGRPGRLPGRPRAYPGRAPRRARRRDGHLPGLGLAPAPRARPPRCGRGLAVGPSPGPAGLGRPRRDHPRQWHGREPQPCARLRPRHPSRPAAHRPGAGCGLPQSPRLPTRQARRPQPARTGRAALTALAGRPGAQMLAGPRPASRARISFRTRQDCQEVCRLI